MHLPEEVSGFSAVRQRDLGGDGADECRGHLEDPHRILVGLGVENKLAGELHPRGGRGETGGKSFACPRKGVIAIQRMPHLAAAACGLGVTRVSLRGLRAACGVW
eukprot:2765957-Rhodomonas_salina.3